MGFLLILPILVSGFICCHEHPRFFYKLHRYEGQYLYLQTAKLGLYSFFAAVFINLGLLYILEIPASHFSFLIGPNYIQYLSDSLVSSGLTTKELSIQISWLTFISFTMIFVIPRLISIIYFWLKKFIYSLHSNEEVRLAIMSELFKDSPLDDLLFSSLTNKNILLLSMEDKKVYVGFVASMGEPNENEGSDQEISLVPVMSGYRDKETMQVTFTTDYSQIDEDFTLILRQDNIVSVTNFDLEVYERFRESTPPQFPTTEVEAAE